MGGNVYFIANDGIHGVEVWKTDGTNTAMVADINPVNPGSSFAGPYELFANNGAVYFAADDGSGKELWRSDGTFQGTYRLMDINPGTAGSYPFRFQAIGNKLVFLAYDDVHGLEPWVTDGTTQGTMLLKDIYPGPTSTSLGNYHLRSFGGGVVFLADDGQHGSELWQTDGTTAGTKLMAEIRPGPDGSTPIAFGGANGWFYFAADDGVAGVEMWRVADDIPPSVVSSKWRPGKTLKIQFSEDVSASLSVTGINISDSATQQKILPSSFSYDLATNTAAFVFGAAIPNGNYSVELQQAKIKDSAGNTLLSGDLPSFYVLRGDANDDGAVGFADLVAVAQHYGQNGMSWSQGDFNDDGTVDFADLVVVAQAYGTDLRLPAASPIAAMVTAKVAAKPILSTVSKFGKRPIQITKPAKAETSQKLVRKNPSKIAAKSFLAREFDHPSSFG